MVERGNMKQEEKKEIIKNMECIECKHLFDCVGKPREVERCVNFEKRRSNE